MVGTIAARSFYHVHIAAASSAVGVPVTMVVCSTFQTEVPDCRSVTESPLHLRVHRTAN